MMNHQINRYALWLYYAVNASPRQYRSCCMQFPDIEELFSLASTKELSYLSGVGDITKQSLEKTASEAFIDEKLSYMADTKTDFLTRDDEVYPSLLNEIYNPPEGLFVRGTIDEDFDLPIAMIGSRKSTKYGQSIAELFSEELSENGAVIVSGMASGIDAAASKGALKCSRPEVHAVAVLGSGIDVVYPAENKDLYEHLCEKGAVISEFLPGTKPTKESFPIRNRIVSGMSRGVLVVEAGEKSGTNITVGLAHEQGREVFAVPGRLTDLQSVGTNRLIQRGEAKPVFCVEDILEEFMMPTCIHHKEQKTNAVDISTLTENQQIICFALREGEADADMLAEKTSLPVNILNSALTSLLFSGIMKQLPGRIYSLDAMNIRFPDNDD